MNNKITIYELLGLIKDGKAPKKIEYDTEKYIWESKLKEYRRYPYDNKLYYSLWSDYDLTKCLNDEVEILDNEDIEEINKMAFVYHVEDEKQNANNDRFRNFINILIDEVNKLKKGNHE